MTPSKRDQSIIEINEDCNTSQFYGYIEAILSKIWENPEDEIYNDI